MHMGERKNHEFGDDGSYGCFRCRAIIKAGFSKLPGKENMAHTRILLADDHKEMRDRVLRLLEPNFEVVGAVDDGFALLEAALKMKPDICIMDISMPKVSGIEAAAQLKESGSKVKVIFLTVHEDPDFVRAALETGALGYVVKSRMASDLSAAINGVMVGRLFVSPSCTYGAQVEMDEKAPQ
jgi:DNA-binding NarL/FixJ family response regulator